MGQLIVRNIEDSVKLRLRRRAARNGRSMEEEARDILRNAVREEETRAGGLGSEIAALFHASGTNAEFEELRGHTVKPASFDR